MNQILRKLRNLKGELQGISGCGICGDTWNWKKEHNIDGAFPICEECWQTRSDRQIFNASNALAKLWMDDTPFSHREETCKRAQHLLDATVDALKNRKMVQRS